MAYRTKPKKKVNKAIKWEWLRKKEDPTNVKIEPDGPYLNGWDTEMVMKPVPVNEDTGELINKGKLTKSWQRQKVQLVWLWGGGRTKTLLSMLKSDRLVGQAMKDVTALANAINQTALGKKSVNQGMVGECNGKEYSSTEWALNFIHSEGKLTKKERQWAQDVCKRSREREKNSEESLPVLRSTASDTGSRKQESNAKGSVSVPVQKRRAKGRLASPVRPR